MSDDNKKDKHDLTRLENIGEFLHQDDAAVDDFFNQLNSTTEETPPPVESTENFPPAFETPKEESSDFSEPEATPEETKDESINFNDEAPSFGDDSSPFTLSEETVETEAEVTTENNLLNEMVDKTMEHAAQDFQVTEEEIPEEIPEEEIIQEPEPEPIMEEAPPLKIAADLEQATFQTSPPPTNDSFKETFQDVKEFASNISYGDVAMGGNPAFSIILKDVRYKEDVDDILLILKEHGLMKENSEETFRKSLERGTLLISHIGEYSAIYLCHKLRRFQVDILMGLADAIHPPKIPEINNRGLVNKKGLRLNQADHLVYDSLKIDVANILTTTTSLIESHEISRYIDTISEHMVLNEDIFEADIDIEEKLLSRDSLIITTLRKIRQVKDLTRDQDVELKTPKLSIKEVYVQLINKLKIQAVKLKGNAIIGIQYQTTPLIGDHSNNKKYKLSCTGTVVWAKRL